MATPKTRLTIEIPQVRIANAQFPESVPILGAGSFVKGISQKGARMCLSQRLSRVFFSGSGGQTHGDHVCYSDSYAARDVVETVMLEVIKDEVKRTPHLKNAGVSSLVDFNDSNQTKTADAARVWNRTMAACGYTEGNPAARTIEAIPALA